MPQWGTKKSSNNRVDREVRTGKGMNSQPSRESEGCWIDVAGGGDSLPAAGGRQAGRGVPCASPPEFPGGGARLRAFQRRGLWRRVHLEIALFVVGLGRIQQAYISGHVLKNYENNKKSDTLQIWAAYPIHVTNPQPPIHAT